MAAQTDVKETDFAYEAVIREICGFDWAGLDEAAVLDAAWAYYFFSVQFQENMEVARQLDPADENLKHLEREESNTDNLSPWPGIAAPGERMNHHEFMRRALELSPIAAEKRRRFVAYGERYLRDVRAMDDRTRALSISSYEDGGLEAVFRAMMAMPDTPNPALLAFKHFLSAHIAFDSDPVNGHGALTRHLRPDDRVLPLWQAFRDIFAEFVPALNGMPALKRASGA